MDSFYVKKSWFISSNKENINKIYLFDKNNVIYTFKHLIFRI